MKEKALYLLAGLPLMAVFVVMVFFSNRGSQIRLEGEIQKVRLVDAGDGATIAVLDFRVANPAKYDFELKEAKVTAELKGGKTLEAWTVADVDARRLFGAIPELGQQFNDTFRVKSRIEAGKTEDRMLTVRFEAPKAEVESRARIRARFEETDGAVSQIAEAGR